MAEGGGIEWPWQYSFPPFFTLQPQSETRSKQISAWKRLILDYCKANKQSKLDVGEASKLPLFNNTTINRSLSASDILFMLGELEKSNNAAPCTKQKSVWEIYWHTPEEWAEIVFNCVNIRGSRNTVLTIYELIEGDDFKEEEFHGLDMDVFLKICNLLQEQGKCEVMTDSDHPGVKFY